MTKRRPILLEDGSTVSQNQTVNPGGWPGTALKLPDMPVFDPVPAPPEPPWIPPATTWETAVPGGLGGGAQEAGNTSNWGASTWYQVVVGPTSMTGVAALTGLWYGLQSPPAGQDYTLWFANAYNVYGLVQDLELWAIGDFVKGREGHGLYIRCMPNMDTTIRRYKAYKIGANAIQREFRTSETQIPFSVWGGGGGTFTVDDCDFRECGLIDGSWISPTGSGPNAARASWVMALYNTKQRTIVKNTKVINYHCPSPHEGSIGIMFGQDAWRTPYAEISDCTLYNRTKDRAEIFLQGVDSALIQHTYIYTDTNAANPKPAWIDIVQGCPDVTVSQMPQEVVVREKKASGPHNAPVNTYIVKKGHTAHFSF